MFYHLKPGIKHSEALFLGRTNRENFIYRNITPCLIKLNSTRANAF